MKKKTFYIWRGWQVSKMQKEKFLRQNLPKLQRFYPDKRSEAIADSVGFILSSQSLNVTFWKNIKRKQGEETLNCDVESEWKIPKLILSQTAEMWFFHLSVIHLLLSARQDISVWLLAMWGNIHQSGIRRRAKPHVAVMYRNKKGYMMQNLN